MLRMLIWLQCSKAQFHLFLRNKLAKQCFGGLLQIIQFYVRAQVVYFVQTTCINIKCEPSVIANITNHCTHIGQHYFSFQFCVFPHKPYKLLLLLDMGLCTEDKTINIKIGTVTSRFQSTRGPRPSKIYWQFPRFPSM